MPPAVLMHNIKSTKFPLRFSRIELLHQNSQSLQMNVSMNDRNILIRCKIRLIAFRFMFGTFSYHNCKLTPFLTYQFQFI